MKLRKICSLVVSTALICGALVGCGNSKSAEQVTLTIWNAGIVSIDGTGNLKPEEVPLNKYIAKFEEENPGVKVEVVDYGMEQLTQLLTASTMSQEGPDIITLWAGTSTNDFKEIIEPLNGHLSDEEIEKYVATELCRVDFQPKNDLQAIPCGITTLNAYYNKEAFAKAGITNIPETWDDFLEMSETLKANSITPLLLDGGGYAEAWVIGEFLADELGPEGITKLGTGEVKFNSDAFVKSYNAWKQVYDKEYVNQDFKSASGDSLKERFISGQGAVMLGGSWNQVDLVTCMGDNVGTFKIPAVRKDAPYADSIVTQPDQNIAITKYSKNKELAVELAKTLGSAEFQTETTKAFGQLPTHIDVDVNIIDNQLMKESYEWVKRDTGVIGFDSLIPGDIANEFYKTCITVNTGKMTVEEFAQKLDGMIEKKLNK